MVSVVTTGTGRSMDINISNPQHVALGKTVIMGKKFQDLDAFTHLQHP
jgi:hypothetical protein